MSLSAVHTHVLSSAGPTAAERAAFEAASGSAASGGAAAAAGGRRKPKKQKGGGGGGGGGGGRPAGKRGGGAKRAQGGKGQKRRDGDASTDHDFVSTAKRRRLTSGAMLSDTALPVSGRNAPVESSDGALQTRSRVAALVDADTTTAWDTRASGARNGGKGTGKKGPAPRTKHTQSAARGKGKAAGNRAKPRGAKQTAGGGWDKLSVAQRLDRPLGS